MDWLYVWSPRYRFFHEILYLRTKDLPGFKVCPIYAEQHLFDRQHEHGHFLAGIPVKMNVVVNYIRENIGKTFFFTDVDLIVMPSFSTSDLIDYETNDITTMKEWTDSLAPNIGCLLIKCSEKTLTFFEGVQLRILRDKDADQDAFIKELTTFTGSVGCFSTMNFLQSHMLKQPSLDPYKIKIVQCIVGQDKPVDIIAEKVCLVSQFMNIDPFQEYLPADVNLLLFGQS